MFVFRLPDIGEGVTEGEIVKWLVHEGDSLQKEQEMVEIMTDKVTVQIPSPVQGKVSRIHFPEGKVVKVGEVLISLDDGKTEQSSNIQGSPAEPPRQEPQTPHVQQPPPVTEYQKPRESVIEIKDEDRRSISKVLASPAIRKLARDLGVDLTIVRGTGPSGRVLEDDVRRYSKARPQASAQVPAPQAPTQVQSPEPAQQARPEQPQQSAMTAEGERNELKGLRRLIFEKMAKSKATMPHFTILESVDMTNLLKLRDDLKSRGLSTGFTAFFVKASASVLKDFPKFNATYNETDKTYLVKRYYNIGVAVDTPDGLTVVVVKEADRKGIRDVAAEISSLAEKARTNKLSLAEVQNSTFTVSNVGSIAGIASTPIINYPEVAILAVHRVEKAINQEGKTYDRMYISLSCDHRWIDGADAARFMAKLRELLEKPDILGS